MPASRFLCKKEVNRENEILSKGYYMKIVIRGLMIALAAIYFIAPDIFPGLIDDTVVTAVMLWLQNKIK